jgi:hypothetical protein
MRYFKEYLVEVHTAETLQNIELGAPVPVEGAWRPMMMDFSCVVSFYEYVESPDKTVVKFDIGEMAFLDIPYKSFKRDFEEYLKQANKPSWMLS